MNKNKLILRRQAKRLLENSKGEINISQIEYISAPCADQILNHAIENDRTIIANSEQKEMFESILERFEQENDIERFINTRQLQ